MTRSQRTLSIDARLFPNLARTGWLIAETVTAGARRVAASSGSVAIETPMCGCVRSLTTGIEIRIAR